MPIDQEVVSAIGNIIAQCDRHSLDLSRFPIPNSDTMRCVLVMIANRCLGAPPDWHIGIRGPDSNTVCQTLMTLAKKLRFRDGSWILQKLTGVSVYSEWFADGGLAVLLSAIQDGRLPQLRCIDLNDTLVTDVSVGQLAEPALAKQLSQLQVLDLSFTGVTDASMGRLAEAAGVGMFPRLVKLGLSGSRVKAPNAILDGTARDILWWYLHRETSNAVLPEAKLLIVGQGNVGKSVLFQRAFLKQEPVNLHARRETHDFDMHEVQFLLDLVRPLKQTDLILRVWDFAGQDELHGSLKFFVGAERAFYLLVLDASRDSRENKLTYWLRFLAHHGRLERNDGDMKAPILVVITQSDKITLAKEDRVSVGDTRTPQAIIRNHHELLAALDSLQQREYFQTNVVGVVRDFGFPGGDDWLTLTSDSRALIERNHQKSCDEVRRVIATHLRGIIGVGEAVASSDYAIRDWILAHFTPQQDQPLLTNFNFREDPFRTWAKEQGFDQQDNQVIDPDALEIRFRNAMRILKSLGLVHWIGDVLAKSNDTDNRLNDVAFNPLWVKTPVHRVLRAEGVKHAKGWISQESVNRLLPLREPRQFPHAVTTENVREWFDNLPFTTEDRSAIKKLLELSGLMFEVTQHQYKEGWLIPDMLKDTDSIDSPISGDVATIKNSFSFLPDRVLLQFLAKRLVEAFGKLDDRDNAIRELLSARVFRNAADLPWKLVGSEETFHVILRTEISPPIDEEPWLSISVSGGDEADRTTILTEVVSRFNDILASEELPLISIAGIRHRVPSVADDDPHSASDWQHVVEPRVSSSIQKRIDEICADPNVIVTKANLAKPISFGPSADTKSIKKTFKLFLAIGAEYQRTDYSEQYPKCSSLGDVIKALSQRGKERTKDQLVDWPGAEKVTKCRDYVYECRQVMDEFFIQHFELETINVKEKSHLISRGKNRSYDKLTPIGLLALERVREFMKCE